MNIDTPISSANSDTCAAMLEEDASFVSTCEKKGLGWSEYDVLVKKIYGRVVASDYYAEYMSAPESSLEADCKFISRIFEEELEDEDMLWDLLEETSVYWADDLGYVLNVIIRDLAAVADTPASRRRS